MIHSPVIVEAGPRPAPVSQSTVISRSHPALTSSPALNPAPPLTFHVPFNLLPPPPHKQWAKAQIPQAMSNPPIKRPATYQYALPVRREAHTLATSGAAPSRRPASRRMPADLGCPVPAPAQIRMCAARAAARRSPEPHEQPSGHDDPEGGDETQTE